jgi:hypothetical protein
MHARTGEQVRPAVSAAAPQIARRRAHGIEPKAIVRAHGEPPDAGARSVADAMAPVAVESAIAFAHCDRRPTGRRALGSRRRSTTSVEATTSLRRWRVPVTLPVVWVAEFFEDDSGRQPAREFLLSLEPDKRAAMIAAIEMVLVPRGLDVCATEYGRQVGDGLFEFRVRHDESVIRGKSGESEGAAKRRGDIVLRLFCHAYGEKVILLLGGYDKGVDASPRRQAREIEQARKRLRSFRLRMQRAKTAARRRK